MFIELTIGDSFRGASFWVQVQADLGAKRWSAQEGDALDFVTFDRGGPLEVKGTEVWLYGQHRKANDRALVLQNGPRTDDDYDHHSGDGRIEGHVSMAFSKAAIAWKAPALVPIRRKVLALCAAILPPYPQLLTPGQLPMTLISSLTHPGVPGETNCYAFPGYIGKQLGSTATVRTTGLYPDMKNPGKYKEQTVVLSAEKGTMSLEQLGSDPSIKAWVPFNGKNRPNPGDFYVLTSDASGVSIAHVGVIVDSTGDLWVTADSGQGQALLVPDPSDPKKTIEKYAKGMAAGYRQRKFDAGKLSGEFGKTAFLKGWVDIDNAALFPAHATAKKP